MKKGNFMPTKDSITEEIYITCKTMLRSILDETHLLGAGYVIQLVYELMLVVVSYECGYNVARDKCLREASKDSMYLVVARNTVNHNSYDTDKVSHDIGNIVASRAVENLYIKIFGEAPGYKIFETECLVYLEYMRRLWGVS